jgi:hypothetical protein
MPYQLVNGRHTVTPVKNILYLQLVMPEKDADRSLKRSVFIPVFATVNTRAITAC